jgi:hypothetical protein
MQVIEDFSEKTEVTEIKKVELGVGDIRFAIEQLPEQLKQKHYGYLQELAEDISAVRDARDITDDDWNERPPQTLPDEANNDAQNIRDVEARPNEVARRDTSRLSKDLEWATQSCDYQSTERWWKKQTTGHDWI